MKTVETLSITVPRDVKSYLMRLKDRGFNLSKIIGDMIKRKMASDDRRQEEKATAKTLTKKGKK